MTDITPLLISRSEAATLLGGISVRHLDRLCAKGELSKQRLGGRAMIVRASLEAYAASPASETPNAAALDFPLPPPASSNVPTRSATEERAA